MRLYEVLKEKREGGLKEKKEKGGIWLQGWENVVKEHVLKDN